MKRIALLVATATILACSGGGDGNPPIFDAAKLAGNYNGTWTNATYSTSGASRLTVTVNPAAKSGSATWDLDGNVLGQTNPSPETYTGTYSDQGLNFSGTSTTFGDFQLTIDGNGQATGTATNIPNAAISRVDFTGTATETAINLNYTVRFSAVGGGGTARGTVSMTKP